MVGYIPDMIFDRELDYLADLGAGRVALASNSVSVQVKMLRQGAGIGIVHDFSLPFAPELRRVLTRAVSLTRAFYLIRHADDARNPRLARFAELLAAGLRAEVARLEHATRVAPLTARRPARATLMDFNGRAWEEINVGVSNSEIQGG